MWKLLRPGLALAFILCSLSLGASTAMADSTVTISDTGFSPNFISAPVGTTVTFTNAGTKVHTATTKTAPIPAGIDTGGLGPGQSFPFNFTVEGTYTFTSMTDCGNPGGAKTGFDCTSTVTVAVFDPSQATNSAPPQAAPTATPTPVLAGPPQDVTVQITPKGMVPPTVTVALGGAVTWLNLDNTATHTATTIGGGNPTPFDTGGLGPGLQGSVGFSLQGTYTYTSATDCLNGNKTSFSCGPYTIVISGQTSALTVPQTGAPVGITPGSITTVTLDEAHGFSPPTLPIKVGQTVTWTNNGTRVHDVVSNPGYPNTFNSGGLNPGKSFSFTFTSPGSFGYHSDTEATYTVDGMGNQVPQWLYNGTIVAG